MTDREQPQVFFIMLGIAAFGEMSHFETFTLFISLSLTHTTGSVQYKGRMFV